MDRPRPRGARAVDGRLDPQGIGAERLSKMDDPQQIYDLVLAHYLAGAISLGRVAELLDLSALDLQFRFQRLDVPLNLGVEDERAVLDEVEAARIF